MLRIPITPSESRHTLATRLAQIFPDAIGEEGLEAAVARAATIPFHGGHAAAKRRLVQFDPVAYGRSRNHLHGMVSRLSPWIRHGVLSLTEVRDDALAKVSQPRDAEKFVSELAWRDYWQQVYATVGDGIRRGLEPPSTRPRRPAETRIPADVQTGQTGMDCIDAFIAELTTTGWLHNHARMWLASWLVHIRGVAWETAADWFLQHLVDGDPASNHLSFQWIAGTFSARPYLFNRENLERFTDGRYCHSCPVRGHCDVEGSYEQLAARCFGDPPEEPRNSLHLPPAPVWQLDPPSAGHPLVWLTIDSVGSNGPAAARHPDAPRIFIFDEVWLRRERPTLKRLLFLVECLADSPEIEIWRGDSVDLLRERAAVQGCDWVAVTETPCPVIRHLAEQVRPQLPIHVVPRPPLADRTKVADLGRFSRYWSRIGRSALRSTSS